MLGKVTLVMMIALITISVYIKVKYQWFITIQQTLGAMIFLGGYHALFVTGSDIRANPPLFAYFILLGGIAAGLYVYRSLFHRSIKRKLNFVVHSVWHSEAITIIWLKPLHKALAFYAGQFAFFQFSSAAVDTESHPFSISSGSNNEYIRIAAKASGDYTSEVDKLSVGDGVMVEGPYGHFSFTKIRSKRQVWVAGGIGITPFLSMAHSLPSDYKVTLYYCVRTSSQAIFREELEKVMSENPSLRVVIVCDDQNQRITAKEMISNSAEDYLLCAPPAMMHSLEEQLRTLGVPKHNIHYEDFALT
jgi:predicted ferric reductase